MARHCRWWDELRAPCPCCGSTYQFTTVDLSVWAGLFVPPYLRQKTEDLRQNSPSRLTDKKGRNTASRPRRVRDSQTQTQSTQSLRSSLRANPHQRSSGREAKRTRAPKARQAQLSRLSGPQRCPSSIHLFSNARRLAQSEPGAHQSLVACVQNR